MYGSSRRSWRQARDTCPRQTGYAAHMAGRRARGRRVWGLHTREGVSQALLWEAYGVVLIAWC